MLITHSSTSTAAETRQLHKSALPCISWFRGANCQGLEETLILCMLMWFRIDVQVAAASREQLSQKTGAISIYQRFL